MPPKLKTRKPTGIVPWPLILIEGDEGSGKTYCAAEFSASDRIGQMYFLDLAEGSADEYAAIEGSEYDIVVHDGTFRDILEQIEAVHAEARRAALAKEPPVVLVVDSGSALWRMLTNWTHERARRSHKNAATLAEDPDAPVDVPMNLWNDTNERWQKVIYLLQTLPGIAIITARGKQITAIDEDGRPVKERGKVVREWKVAAQRDLGFDSNVWVRMRREHPTQIIKARSLRLRIEPGKPLTVPKFSVEDLVFNKLGCSVESQPRVMPALSGDRVQPWLERVMATVDVDKLKTLWHSSHPAESGMSREEATTVQAAIMRRKFELENPAPEMGEGPMSDAEKLRAAVSQQGAKEQPEPEPDEDAAAEPAPTPARGRASRSRKTAVPA